MISYNPIAGGLLSGKHNRQAGPMAGTRFTLGTAGATYQDRYWHERELAIVEALRPLAAEAGMSMAQMAVAWALRDPRVTSVLIGASSVVQLEQNVAALEAVDLTPDEITTIDRYAVDGGIDLWRIPATS